MRRKIKINVNISRIRTIIVNQNIRERENINVIKWKREPVNLLIAYEYLEVMITNEGKVDLKITDRVTKATKNYYALNKTIFGKT